MYINVIEPQEGAVVRQLTDRQISFVKDLREVPAEEFDWANLKQKKDEYSHPLPVVFRWQGEGEAELYISKNQDLSDPVIYKGEASVEIYNLLIGQTYYWYVRTSQGVSEKRSFSIDPLPPRLILAGGLSNVRDLGGWVTKENRKIRQGLVYRGCEMEFHHTITPEGIRILRKDLGIRTDLDLRFEAEGKITQSALGEDVSYVLIPCQPYGAFVQDKETAGKIFRLLTEEKNYPFYIHCWGGADRTGTIALILGAVLGLGEDCLYEDYEFTSLSIWGNRSRKSENFCDLLEALGTYPGRNLEERCRAFLLDCGISVEELEAIRRIMLVQDVGCNCKKQR